MLSQEANLNFAKDKLEKMAYEQVLPALYEMENKIETLPEGSEKDSLKERYEELAKAFIDLSDDIAEADARITEKDQSKIEEYTDPNISIEKVPYIDKDGFIFNSSLATIREDFGDNDGASFGRAS